MNEKDKYNNGLAQMAPQHSASKTAITGEPPSSMRAKNTQEDNAFARADEKPFKSAGERIHNELTYRGVDYVMNAAAGVAFAFWASRTKTGDKIFTQNAMKLFKPIVRPFVKSEQAAIEPAKWGTKFLAIMFGGTVTIPPIMYLEHKPTKVNIVRGLDEDIYGKERVESDPRFQESYDRILQEPKKSFSVGMFTRIIAIVPLITASMMVPNTLAKWVYNPIARMSRGVVGQFGARSEKFAPNSFWKNMAPDETGQLVTNWDHLHKTIGFDFGLTIAYSFLHEWTYKSMTRWLNPKEEVREVATPSSNRAVQRDVPRVALKENTLTKPDTKIQKEQIQTERMQPELAAGQGV